MSDWLRHRSSGLIAEPTGGKAFALHLTATMLSQPDVYTLDEIARAAGVPLATVERLVSAGVVKPIAGSQFFDTRAAVKIGQLARREAAAIASPDSAALPTGQREERSVSAVASSLLHGVVLALLIWSTSSVVDISAKAPHERLVFLAGPGPGGGGGGGGKLPKAPVKRIEKPRPTAAETLEPTPPQPLPAHTLVSPIAMVAGDAKPTAPEDAGTGPGVGPGTDDGTGGGAGGGPYRPGSGIDPPRLVREVKAQYTEDARRKGVTGNVVLEIVIKSDGSVGDVKVLRGLGYGLEDRAIAAVRTWKFSPARRQGTPVDVIVEVEVEFSLR